MHGFHQSGSVGVKTDLRLAMKSSPLDFTRVGFYCTNAVSSAIRSGTTRLHVT